MMKHTSMNVLSATLLALLFSAALTGCSESGDHGHPHEEGDHNQDGEAAHSQDQPETDAYYGDEADHQDHGDGADDHHH